jgi:hypothetical protein
VGALKDLLRSHSYTLERAEFVLQLKPTLLLRVDQRRQPLPSSVIVSIAALLGEEIGTVEQAAGLVTSSDSPRFLEPQPPVPILGDKF